MKVRELSSTEFEFFTQKYNVHSLYQTVEYGQAMKEQGFGITYLGLVDENSNVLAASLILIDKTGGFKYGYAPRGFLIDYSNQNLVETFTKGVKKILGKNDVIALKINPLIIKTIYDHKNNVIATNNYYNTVFEQLKKLGFYHLGYNNYFESFKPRFEAIIDINMPYYMLFKNLKKEFKTKIRGIDNRGLKIYKGDVDDLPYLSMQTEKKYPRDLKYFQDIYLNFSKKNNVEFYYSKLDTETYLKSIQSALAKQEKIIAIIDSKMANSSKMINRKLNADKTLASYQKQLVLATNLLKNQPEGVVTAAALVIKDRDEVYVLMDGYNPEYKYLSSKHLLLWKLIEKYSKEGFAKFNLGGMSNYALINNKYSQLNEFKFGFNAKAYEYMGDLEIITNPARYFVYRNASPLRSIIKK